MVSATTAKQVSSVPTVTPSSVSRSARHSSATFSFSACALLRQARYPAPPLPASRPDLAIHINAAALLRCAESAPDRRINGKRGFSLLTACGRSRSASTQGDALSCISLTRAPPDGTIPNRTAPLPKMEPPRSYRARKPVNFHQGMSSRNTTARCMSVFTDMNLMKSFICIMPKLK